MMKFIFNDGNIKAFGYEFKDGVATEVKNPDVIKKLEGNSHFKKVTTTAKRKSK